MAAKFEYYNNSTEDIIGVPLMIVSGSPIDAITGAQRTNLAGEITASRPIVNEYGVQKEHLQFTYSLMKSDDTDFNVEEQVAVEAWLTSPRFSSELKFTDCEDNSYSYFGKFLTTEWTTGTTGFILCTFTFQVNGSYAFRRFEQTLSNIVYNQQGSPDHAVDGDVNYMINVDTDEYEEYVYPVIDIYCPFHSDNASFTLTNVTDDEQSMSITTKRTRNHMVFDCQKCMVRDKTGIDLVIDFDIIRYKDLGWGDVGNIYWFRLLPGENVITLNGHVEAKLTYYAPYKKVGGWLI